MDGGRYGRRATNAANTGLLITLGSENGDQLTPFGGLRTVLRLSYDIPVASMARSSGITIKDNDEDPSRARRAIAPAAATTPRRRGRFPSILPMSLGFFRQCSTTQAYLVTAAVVVIITIVVPECLALVRNF